MVVRRWRNEMKMRQEEEEENIMDNKAIKFKGVRYKKMIKYKQSIWK
jgi:hypothetical protein